MNGRMGPKKSGRGQIRLAEAGTVGIPRAGADVVWRAISQTSIGEAAMEAAERSELDATIKLMRGELKQARLYLEMDSLESVRSSLESVAREARMAADDLRRQGVLLERERGTRLPPA